jgi:NAD(P)-dependent dehydrogenase (short-subunit alcohol dehydrogenase family)
MPDSTNGNNRIALVTGAGKRIGQAIALRLAESGWDVGVHYQTSKDEAGETAEEIRSIGQRAEILEGDLGDPSDMASLVERCAASLGAPACLVNNASMFEWDDIDSLDLETWDRQFDVNLRAPVFLSREFAAHLPRGANGCIINIIDQRVWRLTPRFMSYTISKSALWTATRTLAQALAPEIRVNAIGPGPTLRNDRQDVADFELQQKATLLKLGPSPDEIADAVCFILDASAMTGQMIALDGGQHLAWRTPDAEID